MRVVIWNKKTLNALNKAIIIRHEVIDEMDFAVVSGSQRPNRETYHPFIKDFIIVNRKLDMTVHITQVAMVLWKTLDYVPSLINVQNAVNTIHALGKYANIDNIKKYL